MPDNDPGLPERRRKPKNWFSKAKDFVFKTFRLYEVGHGDNPSDDNPTAHNQPWVVVDGPSNSHVGQAEVTGQAVHHWCSIRLLI